MKKYAGAMILIMVAITSYAQNKKLSLSEAVSLGLQNSRQLQLAQHKTDQAQSQLDQAKDAVLPTAKVSAGYSHALMLARSIAIPSTDGNAPKTLKLPFDNALYQATLSINQPIFSGNQFKYARQSASLLVQLSELNAETDKDAISFNIINAYINYYKLRQNQKVVAQNLQDVESKLEEIKKFEAQGLATKNDVLRFELQKSDIMLTEMDLENNRKIVNYNLDILLGLPETTIIEEEDVSYKLDLNDDLSNYQEQALKNRNEIRALQYQDKLSDIEIKKVKDQMLPTVGVGGNLYFINPTKSIVPKSGAYVAPFIVGVNVGWDISTLYKNKNKQNEAHIEKLQVADNKSLVTDNIKTEVNQRYLQFQQSLRKITVLQQSILQATENERITESKFKNNLASTTERIDAQTLLYQARINLELAKADATAAYYALLQATGDIQP